MSEYPTLLTAFSDLFKKKQKQDKPIAWIDISGNIHRHGFFKGSIPLYTTPQQRKPLTDEQLLQCYLKASGLEFYKSFARAIEAAHGIEVNK